jgi:3-oxoacyl-[acyl-carrier protein] reductase
MTRDFPTYPDLANKVVLVTGSSRGIGAETCKRFAENGAKVVVNGRDEKAIDKVVAEIQVRGGEALGVIADSTKLAELETMRTKIEQAFGAVDILAAFAAGGEARPGPVETISEEAWNLSVDGSLTSTFLGIKTFLPTMMERKRGAIVTMATSAARLARPQAPLAYSAAKAGVVMLTRNVASQVAQYSIRVNCLAPAMILNERLRALPKNQLLQLAQSFPLGRIGQPNDVAQAALFLASDASSWITGITLDIAGGDVML